MLELYDDNSQQPMWGQIVREKPEETELEQLKELSYRNRDEKRAGNPKIQSQSKIQAVFTTTTSSPSTVPTSSLLSHPKPNHFLPHSDPIKSSHAHGQKEIPLLRPPTKAKTVEPAPIITQRSLSVEKKPSPYDTLRKYLSIEDALKKVSPNS